MYEKLGYLGLTGFVPLDWLVKWQCLTNYPFQPLHVFFELT